MSRSRNVGRGFRGTLAERMDRHSIPEPMSGCVLWIGALDGKGYGAIGKDGKTVKAHRVAFELAREPIPIGLDLDHRCRVRCCVNPWHLEPVTRRENIRRGDAGKKLAARTHCDRGHPFSKANTYIRRGGARRCRTCNPRQGKPHGEEQEQP